MSKKNYTAVETGEAARYAGSEAMAQAGLKVFVGIIVVVFVGSLVLGYNPIMPTIMGSFLAGLICLPPLFMHQSNYPDEEENKKYRECADWLEKEYGDVS